jgi:hypothetical protein
MIFDDGGDPLPIQVKVYWEIKPDSMEIKGKYYNPFIFSERYPYDTTGYIRYSNKEIFILRHYKPEDNEEQLLFNFEEKIRSNSELSKITNLNDQSFHLVRKYNSRIYKEKIYVFKLVPNPIIRPEVLDEIHIGIKSGLIKVHFLSHYGSCCDMECVRKIN